LKQGFSVISEKDEKDEEIMEQVLFSEKNQETSR